MDFLETQQGTECPKEMAFSHRNTHKPVCLWGERQYLDQQLEARDPLEGQDEEGGEGQPLALGVLLQLRDQLSKGCLLLAGDTDTRVSLWLTEGVHRSHFLTTHCRVGTRQPTGTKTTSIHLFLFFYGK